MLVLLSSQKFHCSNKGYSNLSKCKPVNSSLANSVSTQVSLQGCQEMACPLPCAALWGGMAVSCHSCTVRYPQGSPRAEQFPLLLSLPMSNPVTHVGQLSFPQKHPHCLSSMGSAMTWSTFLLPAQPIAVPHLSITPRAEVPTPK